MHKHYILLIAADSIAVETVLAEVEPGQEFLALRAAADQHPGRAVTTEWRDPVSGEIQCRRTLIRVPVSPV